MWSGFGSQKKKKNFYGLSRWAFIVVKQLREIGLWNCFGNKIREPTGIWDCLGTTTKRYGSMGLFWEQQPREIGPWNQFGNNILEPTGTWDCRGTTTKRCQSMRLFEVQEHEMLVYVTEKGTIVKWVRGHVAVLGTKLQEPRDKVTDLALPNEEILVHATVLISGHGTWVVRWGCKNS